ncbi:mCG60698 [Mus musculus]|nr:mCG60698 [Mus musculus]
MGEIHMDTCLPSSTHKAKTGNHMRRKMDDRTGAHPVAQVLGSMEAEVHSLRLLYCGLSASSVKSMEAKNGHEEFLLWNSISQQLLQSREQA